MKLLVSVLVLCFSLSVNAVCNAPESSLPRRYPAQILNNNGACPTTTGGIPTSVDDGLISLLDEILPQLQRSLAPSPCEGLGWTKIVDIDMTNQSHSCPEGLVLDTTLGSRRLCRRTNNNCATLSFSSNGLEYSQVCGTVKAYQLGSLEAFEPFNTEHSPATTLDSMYVEGVIISRGSKHVWTFAVGQDELHRDNTVCPCLVESVRVPEWVGNNYFCESGTETIDDLFTMFYGNDPLWDGAGCLDGNNCCSFNNPPYFAANLLENSCEDLTVRVCAGFRNEEDVPVERIELYIK